MQRKTLRPFLCFAFIVLGITNGPESHASEPILTIQTPTKTVAFTYDELLKKAEGAQLLVTEDPTYKNTKMTYTVVPVWKLFDGLTIQSENVVQFKCLDGFSAVLETDRLLNKSEKSSVAYLAIEDPAHHWPPVKPGTKPTAGPFYLVWKNPRLSKIGPEEWPFQLAGFHVKPPLKESFPKIFPDSKLKENNPINHGFRVFVKNCFACHTLNRSGEAQVGPDLNVPYNPTEYLNEKYMKILVRNPENLRHWPEAKMKGFSETALSNGELDDLLAYLRHMAQRKP